MNGDNQKDIKRIRIVLETGQSIYRPIVPSVLLPAYDGYSWVLFERMVYGVYLMTYEMIELICKTVAGMTVIICLAWAFKG